MKHFFPILFLVSLMGCSTSGSKMGNSPRGGAEGVITTIPFVLHDNRILVSAVINGHGPFVMVFDTGGSNILTPEAQNLLERKSQGQEPAAGVYVQSLQVGDFKMTDQKFLVLDLKPIRKTFRFSHLDGVIGYEILRQARVRIDFDRQVIQLLADNAPRLPKANPVAFELVGEKPVVQGKINGRDAKILIDTGDRSNLTLFRKFAAATKLEKQFFNRETMLTGFGVGGPIPGKISSVDKVEIGSAQMTDIMTRLPTTKKGYYFTSPLSASAGVGMLKAYNLEFDYKNKTVAMQKREGYDEPSTFIPVR